VTFLFTDIEGSTRLLQELGERYAEVLAEHRRVLREAWRKHDGSAIIARPKTSVTCWPSSPVVSNTPSG